MSSKFSSVGQMQFNPAICRPPPTPILPPHIPQHAPVYVQSNWSVDDFFGEPFSVSHAFTMEWLSPSQQWQGQTSADYPFTWGYVKPNWEPGLALIFLNWWWADNRAALHTLLTANPTNAETWAPPMIEHDEEVWSHTFQSSTLLLRG